MAVTHSFKVEDDITQGGAWYHDYGQRICTWEWDSDAGRLSVRCGNKGGEELLPQLEQDPTDEVLKERLPAIALSIAERLNETTYDV